MFRQCDCISYLKYLREIGIQISDEEIQKIKLTNEATKNIYNTTQALENKLVGKAVAVFTLLHYIDKYDQSLFDKVLNEANLTSLVKDTLKNDFKEINSQFKPDNSDALASSIRYYYAKKILKSLQVPDNIAEVIAVNSNLLIDAYDNGGKDLILEVAYQLFAKSLLTSLGLNPDSAAAQIIIHDAPEIYKAYNSTDGNTKDKQSAAIAITLQLYIENLLEIAGINETIAKLASLLIKDPQQVITVKNIFKKDGTGPVVKYLISQYGFKALDNGLKTIGASEEQRSVLKQVNDIMNSESKKAADCAKAFGDTAGMYAAIGGCATGAGCVALMPQLGKQAAAEIKNCTLDKTLDTLLTLQNPTSSDVQRITQQCTSELLMSGYLDTLKNAAYQNFWNACSAYITHAINQVKNTGEMVYKKGLMPAYTHLKQEFRT